MRRVRLDARAFLQRIQTWLQAGGWEPDGHVGHPETGTPQGGTGSPGLANADVPSALARWFPTVVRMPGRGEALVCRYADDWGGACRSQEEAERGYRVRPKRREQCNRQGAPETTRRRRFRRLQPSMQRRCTSRGCALAWRPERQGVPRVKRRTARQTLPAACQRSTGGITQHRHLPGRECLRRLKARVQGHSQSDGGRGTCHSLQRLFRGAIQRAYTWRNRRGGKRKRSTGEPYTQVRDRGKRARPRSTEVRRRSVDA